MTARYLVLSDSHGARDVVGLILMAAEAGGKLTYSGDPELN